MFSLLITFHSSKSLSVSTIPTPTSWALNMTGASRGEKTYMVLDTAICGSLYVCRGIMLTLMTAVISVPSTCAVTSVVPVFTPVNTAARCVPKTVHTLGFLVEYFILSVKFSHSGTRRVTQLNSPTTMSMLDCPNRNDDSLETCTTINSASAAFG